MIPLSDDNPTLHTPVMTWLILGVMFAVWMVVQGGGFDPMQLARSICDYGLIPAELTHRQAVGTAVPIGRGMYCVIDDKWINDLTPLLSIFLHGGWAHILGNALYFWVFGNNIEDSMGPGRFLSFFLLCGLVAAGTHIAVESASPVPTVGASGAISGILGGYLMLYPRSRVNILFFFIIIIRVIPIPAWAVLLWWFATQLLTGLPELSQMRPDVSSGVAVWAHIGGFLAGVVLVRFFAAPELVAARRAAREIAPWR